MSAVGTTLQALTVLAPLVEEVVKALSRGKLPDFVLTLPSPLKSEVALAAKKAGLK